MTEKYKESIDEKRLRYLIARIKPITKITVEDMKKYPEAERAIRTAKNSLDNIIRYFDKEKSIDVEFKVKDKDDHVIKRV